MLLGKIVGTLVATRKEPSLDGLRFLVVRRLSIDNEPQLRWKPEQHHVFVDLLGLPNGDFGQVGGAVRLELDTRDNEVAATSGLHLRATGAVYPMICAAWKPAGFPSPPTTAVI